MNTFDSWGNELKHYGVLGQKWGIRKYQNPDGSLTQKGQQRYNKTGEKGYVYKSHTTKKYEKKAAKASQKGNTLDAEKFKKRADISRELDKRELAYAKSVTAGGNFITRMLTGDRIGGKAYQMHMAMNGKTRSTGSKVVSTLLSSLGGRPLASMRKAAVIRSNEDTLFGRTGKDQYNISDKVAKKLGKDLKK